MSQRALVAATRVVWLVIVPALLAALVMRFGLPSQYAENASAFERAIGRWAGTSPLVAGVLLFALFAFVLRYWSTKLERFGFAAPPRASTATAKAKSGERRWAAGGSLVVWVVLAALLALLVRLGLGQSYRVSGRSMLPTFRPGDLLLAGRTRYTSTPGAARMPRRGDVVVFQSPRDARDGELIKRVIGLPGDHVSMRAGIPSINGWEVPFCDAGRYVELGPEGVTDGRLVVEYLDDRAYLVAHTPLTRPAAEYDVKPGEIFVLGDNRNQSLDSRFWNHGQPAALAVSDVEALVSRRLTRAGRDGNPLFESFLEPIDTNVEVAGANTRSLQYGIDYCLKHPPKNTTPPASRAMSSR